MLLVNSTATAQHPLLQLPSCRANSQLKDGVGAMRWGNSKVAAANTNQQVAQPKAAPFPKFLY